MGYRGSKSVFILIKKENKKNIAKEQRVDGSYSGYNIEPGLRCTLMAFERKYPFKNPTKQLNNRKFSTLSTPSNLKINP
jgi:hypothetical protein